MATLRSPFPGMDPYLEDPAEWQSCHLKLIAAISDLLAAAVAPAFFVRVDQRVYLTAPGDPDRSAIEPDVYILREGQPHYAQRSYAPGITPPVRVEPPEVEPEIRDRYLEIRDARSREVVTIIELLSPFNKRPGAQGYGAFQRKRQQTMSSQVHWIEIDLLRAGERPVETAYKGDYYALLKRGDSPASEGWFFNLRNQMPTIAVPLRPPYADVPLDLQQILHEIYVRARYAYSIDYTQPVPPPPLRPEDESWAREQIAAWLVARAEEERAQ
jgi:hypothetical protein